MRSRKFRLVVFLTFLSILPSCAHVASNGTQTTRPVTPFEQILVWNATLAQANLDVAKGVVNANATASIDVSTANRILTAQSKIADSDKQLTVLFQKGQAALTTADGQQIQALISAIQAGVNDMVGAGTLGIKDPVIKGQVTALINQISTLASQIYSLFQTLTVPTAPAPIPITPAPAPTPAPAAKPRSLEFALPTP